MSSFTATQTAATSVTGVRTSYRALVGAGLAATVKAALATTLVAAAGSAAGISLNVAGGPIPVPGFGVMTAIFSVVGIVIAVALARFAFRARTAFVRTTVALTALSFGPDLAADAASTTKALLMTTHAVAAAIVIPAIARRLAD